LVQETVPPLKKAYEPPNSSMSDEEILLAHWSDPNKTPGQRIQERKDQRREYGESGWKTFNRCCGRVNLVIVIVVFIIVIATGGGVYFAYVRE
jgi:hypothetical protein